MKFKFFILFTFFIVLSTLTVVSNYKIKTSFIDQAYLTFDFNNGEFNIPINVIENINHTYPNITGTGLPIIVLKARYYLENDSIEKGLELLRKKVRDNPYFNIRNIEFANYYLRTNQIDSALYFSNLAMKNYPNSQAFAAQNFLLKAGLGKKNELFETLKNIPKKTEETYKNFLDSYMYEDYGFDKRIDSLINFLLKEYPENEKFQEFKVMNLITKKRYNESYNHFNLGKSYFEKNDFLNSYLNYCKSIEINPYINKAYLNFIICLMKLKRDKEAKESLEFYEKSILNNDGDLSYYLALFELENNNNELGCNLLKKSKKLGCKISNLNFVIKNFCSL